VLIETTGLPDVLLLTPHAYRDNRGFFMETWNDSLLESALGSPPKFVQDNHSRSAQNVLRGLHYQLAPLSQGKLVRVVRGAVFDVAVDLRRSSAAFGSWYGVELSGENHRQLWIPPGFAHGFLALEGETDLIYKVTRPFAPSHDRSIRRDDPQLGIDWPTTQAPILSEKDSAAPFLKDTEVFT
jgi:dTDP-4-dehydrorhamnose 3,5-epimerase